VPVQITNTGTGTLSGLSVSLGDYEQCGFAFPWLSGWSLGATTAPTTLTIEYPHPTAACGAYANFSVVTLLVVESSVPGVAPDTVAVTLNTIVSDPISQAQTNPATSVSSTSAFLQGSTNGDGHFAWFTLGTDSASVADDPGHGMIDVANIALPAFGSSNWSAVTPTLQSGAKYYFQMWAMSTNIDFSPPARGGVLSFTTQ
jgi:hypothetical protein